MAGAGLEAYISNVHYHESSFYSLFCFFFISFLFRETVQWLMVSFFIILFSGNKIRWYTYKFSEDETTHTEKDLVFLVGRRTTTTWLLRKTIFDTIFFFG